MKTKMKMRTKMKKYIGMAVLVLAMVIMAGCVNGGPRVEDPLPPEAPPAEAPPVGAPQDEPPTDEPTPPEVSPIETIPVEEADIEKIRQFVTHYYLYDDPLTSNYPEMKVELVEFPTAEEFEKYDEAGYNLSLATGIDKTWREYLAETGSALVRTTFSYKLTDEQMAGGPQYPSGTYTQFAIIAKTAPDEFQLIDKSML